MADNEDLPLTHSNLDRSATVPPLAGPPMRQANPSSNSMDEASAVHPVGVAAGAVTGGVAVAALTGVALGSVLGPFGAAVGAAAGGVIGGLAGGYAGKAAAEAVNPTVEEHYWRSTFATRPYVTPSCKFEDYREAYAFGDETRMQYPELSFDEAEATLKGRWEAASPPHKLPWSKACPAVNDAWDRLSPHDPDLD